VQWRDLVTLSGGGKSPGLIPDMRSLLKATPVEEKKTIPVKDMFISLAGSPGAGKTTHGKMLSERYGIPHISVGKILRKEVADGTTLGLLVKPYVEKGDLAPAEMVAAVVKNRLSQPDCRNGFILDGYPRKMEDLRNFEDIAKDLGIRNFSMICLDVSPDVVIERMKDRRVCDNGHEYNLKTSPPKKEGVCDIDGLPVHQRDDDKPETIRHRFEVFREETLPVLDYYGKKGGLKRIDAGGDIETVSKRLTDLLDPKEPEEAKKA
jgi:adenylate kinase